MCNKIRLWLVCSLWLASTTVWAQSPQALPSDSLQQQLRKVWVWQNKNLGKVKKCLKAICERARAQSGATSDQYLRASHQLAVFYLGQKRWLFAKLQYKKILKVYETGKTPKTQPYWTALAGMAWVNSRQNRWQQATRICENALQQSPPDSLHRFMLASLRALGCAKDTTCHQTKRKFDQALQHLPKHVGKHYPLLATYVLDAVADVYWRNQQIKQANALYKTNVQWLGKALWQHHPLLEEFRAKMNARKTGVAGKNPEHTYPDAQKVMKYFGISQEKMKKMLLSHPKALFFTLKNITLRKAVLVNASSISEDTLKQHLQQVGTALGTKHFLYGVHLLTLADWYCFYDRHTEAKKAFKNAKIIFLNLPNKALGKNFAQQVDWHRLPLMSEDELAKVEPNLWQYLQTLNKVKIPGRSLVLGENFAIMQRKLGRSDQSFTTLKRLKNAVNLDSLLNNSLVEPELIYDAYAALLGGLAIAHLWNQDYDKALALIKEAINITARSKQKNRVIDKYLQWLFIQIHHRQKKYAQSDSLFKLYINQRGRRWRASLEYTQDFRAYGYWLCERGQYQKADSIYQNIAPLFKARDSTNYQEYYTNFLYSTALLYTQQKRYKKAKALWLQLNPWHLERLQRVYPYLSEAEKLAFRKTSSTYFNQFNNFAIDYAVRKPNITRQMYDVQLARKAVIWQGAQQLKRRVLGSGDTTLIDLYEQWLSLRERLNKLYSMSPTQVQSIQQETMEQVEGKANILEKQLEQRSTIFSKAQKVTWQDIRRKLQPQEAAIELLRVVKFEKFRYTTPRYVALVITPKTKRRPHLILLPQGKAMELKYALYFKRLRAESNDFESYQHYFAPIAQYLKKHHITKVYLSPDGVYHKLNLNTLRGKEGFIYQAFDIRLVSSTRALLAPAGAVPTPQKTACLMGGAHFSLDSTRQKQALYAIATGKSLALSSQKTAPRTGVYEYLPSTKTEVESLATTFKSKGYKARLFMGDQALEEVVKALPSMGILHIATHGYFSPKASKSKRGKWIRPESSGCGLVLAGRNTALQDTNRLYYGFKADDAHLRAAEIAMLDLEDTDLVVLSACETARGKIVNGEGVYGLQQAFRTAGAKSVLMSLWRVHDAATQRFMLKFYEVYLATGNKRLALKKTRDFFVNHRRYNHPYYWGAFVLVDR